MGLIFYAGRTAVRSAARNSGKPTGKPKEWQAGTKVIFTVAVFATMIAMGGAARTIAFVIIGLITVSVVVALIYCIAHRNDIRKPAASDVDKVLDDLLGDKTGRKP